MGKRQVIYTAEELSGNRELLDKEVNLLTTAKRVWHGKIVSLDQSELVLRDARSGKHRIALKDIDKVYREIVTPY